MMAAQWLHVVWVLPLLGALLACLFHRNEGSAAAGCTGAACGLTAVLYTGLLLTTPAEQVLASQQLLWPTMGLHYALVLDGWNRLPLLLLVWLIPMLMWLLPAPPQLRRNQVGALALLQAFTAGALLAGDALLFYGFFELTMLPCLALWWWLGGPERQSAGLRFVLYTLFGSLPLLVGLLGLAQWAAPGGQPSTLWADLAQGLQARPEPLPWWIVASCTLACLIKLPLFPFHGWLRAAYGQAPMELTICLAAMLGKLGVYAFARIVLGLMPNAVPAMAPWLAAMASIGLLYFALLAWQAVDVKDSLACLSASHVQLLFLGLLTASPVAMAGTLVAVFHHGVIITTLLLLLVFLEGKAKSTTTTLAASSSWSTEHAWPLLALAWLVAVAAGVGLPGLSGFVGEWLILVGTYSSAGWFAQQLAQTALQWSALLATLGLVFAGLYGLRLVGALPQWQANFRPGNLGASSGVAIVLPGLLLLLVLGGCWPQPWLEQVKPALAVWQTQLHGKWQSHELSWQDKASQEHLLGNRWPALPGAQPKTTAAHK